MTTSRSLAFVDDRVVKPGSRIAANFVRIICAQPPQDSSRVLSFESDRHALSKIRAGSGGGNASGVGVPFTKRLERFFRSWSPRATVRFHDNAEELQTPFLTLRSG